MGSPDGAEPTWSRDARHRATPEVRLTEHWRKRKRTTPRHRLLRSAVGLRQSRLKLRRKLSHPSDSSLLPKCFLFRIAYMRGDLRFAASASAYTTKCDSTDSTGSAESCVEHWWAERITAVALVPLCLWFVASIIAHSGSDNAVFIAWIRTPLATS